MGQDAHRVLRRRAPALGVEHASSSCASPRSACSTSSAWARRSSTARASATGAAGAGHRRRLARPLVGAAGVRRASGCRCCARSSARAIARRRPPSSGRPSAALRRPPQRAQARDVRLRAGRLRADPRALRPARGARRRPRAGPCRSTAWWRGRGKCRGRRTPERSRRDSGHLEVRFRDGGAERFDDVVVTLAAPARGAAVPRLSRRRAARASTASATRGSSARRSSSPAARRLLPHQHHRRRAARSPAVIEMSALVDRARHFGGHTLVYLPKYLAPDDPSSPPDDEVEELFLAGAGAALSGSRRERRAGVPHLARASTCWRSPPSATRSACRRSTSSVAGLHLVKLGPHRQRHPQRRRDRRSSPSGCAASAGLAGGGDGTASACEPMTPKPLASLSLDLDNQWSYLKTHGDAGLGRCPPTSNASCRACSTFSRRATSRITFFVVGQDAALEQNRDALARARRAGHEIGNHSFHHEPWLHRYSRGRDRGRAGAGGGGDRARRPGSARAGSAAPASACRSPRCGCSAAPRLPLRRVARSPRSSARWRAPTTSARRAARRRPSGRSAQILFGTLADGLRPLAPYRWRLGDRAAVRDPGDHDAGAADADPRELPALPRRRLARPRPPLLPHRAARSAAAPASRPRSCCIHSTSSAATTISRRSTSSPPCAAPAARSSAEVSDHLARLAEHFRPVSLGEQAAELEARTDLAERIPASAPTP